MTWNFDCGHPFWVGNNAAQITPTPQPSASAGSGCGGASEGVQHGLGPLAADQLAKSPGTRDSAAVSQARRYSCRRLLSKPLMGEVLGSRHDLNGHFHKQQHRR